MEDYVVPDFYDVLVGVDVTGSDKEDGNEIHSTSNISWTSSGGVSNKYPTVEVPAISTFGNEPFTFTIEPNDTTESVVARINSMPDRQKDALIMHSKYELGCGV